MLCYFLYHVPTGLLAPLQALALSLSLIIKRAKQGWVHSASKKQNKVPEIVGITHLPLCLAFRRIPSYTDTKGAKG